MAGAESNGDRRKPGRSIVLAVLSICAVMLADAEPGRASSASGGLGGIEAELIGDFSQPVHVTRAPGRKNRRLVFVTEQEGVVRIVRGSRVRRRPFLDIRDQVRAGGEEGLLSIAFDPDYVQNRRFYAYLTDTEGDIRISQYRARRGSRTRASSKPRRVIVIPHPGASNHNGGTVAFGPDGLLYVGTGDGGGSCDRSENAQNPRSLLGKLLRIDPRRRRGYRIPSGNPFVRGPARPEIYASGLRNPFRFSFDPPTRTIAIGDVGQNEVEEVNYETLSSARGANFGWDAFEGSGPIGTACDPDDSAPPPPDHSPPVHEYRHSGPGHTGCAITGGVVVRDRRLGSLFGRYLYADFCTGQLRSLIPALGRARADRALGVAIPRPTSFGSLRRGRVYVTSIAGGLYRLVAERP